MDIVLDYFDGTVAFSFSVWLSSFGIISARIGWVELRSAINDCIALLGKVQAIVYRAAQRGHKIKTKSHCAS